MLVEFTRVVEVPTDMSGEDDGIAGLRPLPISINPQFVAAVTPSTQHPDIVIIKLSDGRGYQVRGQYAQILEAIQGNGRLLEGPTH